ncbi:MAG: 16S rRNA (cytosine(1402)-N(4))-methyltransferase RsmH [Phycisphaeraceae bacterium]|nr:16S rRNA (cytosine(1402)-N(4))-methyltransferase RsmH [Phycisphaeraceae bacterium]
MTDSDPKPHKRRARYSGTHPKAYSQKYKEKHPDKFPELHERLRAKGKTPASTHVPIMVEEVLGMLSPQPGEIVVDCTLGYGGHTYQFSKRLGPTGRIIGLDVDGDELDKTRERLTKIATPLTVYRKNYAGLASVLGEEKLPGVDIIFADVGVSSMQVDDPARGISYKHKGPLDMRMDSRLKETGIDLLQKLSAEELSLALKELSDEPDHNEIAKAIVAQRVSQPITQTGQLIRLVFQVKRWTPKSWKEQQKKRFNTLHPAARTFQALRILVNDELGSLTQLLRIAPQCLNPGGRIGIISFHSGEDRLVKQSFREGKATGLYELISGKPITPRRKEIQENPRSSAAKFRYAKVSPESEVQSPEPSTFSL